MRNLKTAPRLNELFERVLFYAEKMNRSLPEIRFLILNGLEFASLLEKNVYPVSPINIWEGRNMVTKKLRIESGQESSLYYEVVQTGNPSYAYLNDTNSDMVQASVMAHVVGHCEFSELNVLKDSNPDRTEFVMHLVKKVNLARQQMGYLQYSQFWNACESSTSLIASSSQYSLENSIDSDVRLSPVKKEPETATEPKKLAQPYSSTLSALFQSQSPESAFKKEITLKTKTETISRKGYKLRAPCQDIMGFLNHYAPASHSERSILDYLYTVHKPHEFVMKTQIMNEGWAMYWEKKIMLELFREKAVKGVIDYARVFSQVCNPRPFFMRNPYHLGYHLWCHIEEHIRLGKFSLEFLEEKDQKAKDTWHRPMAKEPTEVLGSLVKTITDYEFLRRFLTPSLINEFHLNRIDKRTAKQLGLKPKDLIRESTRWVWIDPEPIKEHMLKFFAHFNRPRLYLIDSDFMDGGLLMYHRDDGRTLKKKWIEPTLKNINYIWKAPVSLYTQKRVYHYSAGKIHESEVGDLPFEQVVDRMQKNERPFR